MAQKKLKAIVTGGAGFIGSNLVDYLLEKKFQILVIDNFETGRLENLKNSINSIKIIKKDISQYNQIEKYFKGYDYVFHLAALADIVPSIENPDKYFNTNVNGTLKCHGILILYTMNCY